jgi:nucleoside-diphosphate-sugar epimerase
MGNLHNKTIALVGCGDIGCRLAPQLLAQGAVVHGFRRNIAALPAGVIPHTLDVQQPATLTALHDIAFDYVVVTLSPGEMSDAAYKATYVDGLQNILAALNTTALHKLIWISSTSVYGQSDGSDVDEQSTTEPARYAGQRQLQAEQLLKALGDKACVVRFSGIYREGRHRMIEQIRAGKISSQIENDYITNRIHIADCVGVLQHLINLDAAGKPLQPVYLASDSSPVHYSELVHWLAGELGITLQPEGGEQTPRVGSKRCVNTRLLESGYQFQYPTYKAGFRELLRQ